MTVELDHETAMARYQSASRIIETLGNSGKETKGLIVPQNYCWLRYHQRQRTPQTRVIGGVVKPVLILAPVLF
ncbi:hypothetical protein CDAR_276251 [Caerostris darwini]|uniref:Uncharacterized protein n=1 Tax=Caerostris darwini TaxID=1538125 RepID=A0AAV4PZH3_9ARAC|nr:hypothetical protein CDAR_276251 [Caerostris darwini]